MQIVLRKIAGELTPLFRTQRGRSFGPRPAPGAVQRFLLAPLMFAVLAIAFVVAFFIGTGGFHLPDAHTLGMVSVFGITSKELREKRATLANEAKAILDKATAEKRELSAEDNQNFDRIHAEIDRLKGDVDRIEKQERVDGEMGESRGVVAGRPDTLGTQPRDDEEDDDVETVAQKEQRERAEKRQARAFSDWVRYGMEGLTPQQRSIMQGRYRAPEQRAPQTVTTTGGGYLIPQGFSGQLEESMKAYGGVEQAADVFTTETGNTLPWPTVDDTAQTGALLAINTQIAEQIVTYGQVSFAAYKFTSKLVLVPVELLQDAAFNLDAHLSGVLGTRLARVHNTYQTTGTGSSQPKGIVAGSSSGVTAAGASSITYDELLDLEHSVDPAYRLPAFGAGFMFNDGSLLKLKKLKDGEGRPLWSAGLAVGAPDRIDGFPYHINQDMDAMTTGLKPVLFGALKKFKVRKVKEVTLLRLVERYADYHQVGFVAFTRFDSNMLDAGTDPCKYITMA